MRGRIYLSQIVWVLPVVRGVGGLRALKWQNTRHGDPGNGEGEGERERQGVRRPLKVEERGGEGERQRDGGREKGKREPAR